MPQKLPVNNFKRITNQERFSAKYIKKYSKVSDKGYIIDVDVKYLKHLHEKHKYIPFMPEKLNIHKTHMLFYYNYIKPRYSKSIELCYMDIHSFILHIRNVDFYKDKFLKINLIHQIIQRLDHNP